MMRGARWSIIGSVVLLGSLGVLAGCSGMFRAEREPWRREAEVACLNSGAVREGPGKVRIKSIDGPGMCGADYPIKVSSLGYEGTLGYTNELRPPSAIPNGSMPPWPVRQAPAPYEGAGVQSRALPPPGADSPMGDAPMPLDARRNGSATGGVAPYDARGPYEAQPPSLGPARGAPATVGPVTVAPAATLACPIVSALDEWIANSVQPAAMRWFGQPVAEIRQISAYSCRGMNGNPNARISEHAFGNALDIASFTLADGRKITVKNGWKGAPEEQGFLRDVQGAACNQFTTVLAPGSNVFHYDHIHVDLMRRSDGHRACNPHAVSGEEVAARAAARLAAQRGGGWPVHENATPRRLPPPPGRVAPMAYSDDDMPHRRLPSAVPGADGED